MTEATYDVIGIGNAIVDVLAVTGESILAQHGLDVLPLDEEQRRLSIGGGIPPPQGPSLHLR